MIDVSFGIFVNDPSRWAKDGVVQGDFIPCTSATGDIDSPDKVHLALASPRGTELIVCRGDERLRIVLGKGVIEREKRQVEQ